MKDLTSNLPFKEPASTWSIRSDACLIINSLEFLFLKYIKMC